MAGVVSTLLAVGVWALIGQGASYSKLWNAVQRANAWWLALALAATIPIYLGYALLYQGASRVRGGPRPHLALALRMTIAVFGAAVVATAAGRLGSEYWSLRRMQETRAVAWARVLALNVMLWAVLGGLAWVGALVCLGFSVKHIPLGVELAWLLAAPGCTLLVLFVSSPRHHHLTEPGGGRVRTVLGSVVHSLVLLRSLWTWRPGQVRGLVGGLIYWGAQLVMIWAAIRAFGPRLGYGPLLLGYTTGYVATILPLPIGGAGGVEAAIIYSLTLVGIPLGPALLGTLVQRLFTFWLPLAVALVSARRLRNLGPELEAVVAVAAD
ncbi:MAG TPA: lysylphosphatidylglycerol synthase transmembrane domain-containing protein [Solirubrobacteraceae bacterium]|nr:lysylphosphatidylglycerol synthase transmembrane domain-containing protein [Solirubrobacteraceae bacterium]